MKKQLLFLMVCISLPIMAQTGIGTTTPNSSAKLEVMATDKGFLPPRVALTASNVFSPIVGTAANATGLLVYNTNSAGSAPNNVVPGYYYWNGSAWIQISGSLVIDTKTGGFTLGATDNNKLFFISSSTAVIVTVQTLPIGFSCQFIQTGAGTITLSGSGSTLNSANGLTTRTTNSVIGLVMNGTTTGYVFGDTIF